MLVRVLPYLGQGKMTVRLLPQVPTGTTSTTSSVAVSMSQAGQAAGGGTAGQAAGGGNQPTVGARNPATSA